jgi:RNA polymerase sigma factor (sigma-70 family)
VSADTTDVVESIAADDSPEERLLVTEIGTLIATAIGELPPPLRDAARLRFIDEVSYPEMAEALAITVENARKRVQQSRRMLRERLMKDLRPHVSDA